MPIQNLISFQDVILDTIKEPIYAIDTDLKIVLWNKAISVISGIDTKDVMNKPIIDIFTFAQVCLTEDLADDKSSAGFVTIRGKEFRTIIDPIVQNGKHVGYKGGLFSVDDGILMALPREYLVDVINASPESTVVFNIDGSIMYSNNAYIKLWNLSKEDLKFINHKYNIFLDKQLKQQGLMPYIESAFAGEVPTPPVFKYSFNTQAIGRAGQEKVNWLLAHIFPIVNKEGEVIYVVLNFSDISEQYKLELAVKESQEQLALALEGGDLGTWDWDAETQTLIYNDRWAEMIGYTLEEVYDITWEKLIHPEDSDKTNEALYDLIEGRTNIYDCEFRLKTKDGGWKWILSRGKLVENVNGVKSMRVAGTHIDISQRKQAEQSIRDSEMKYRRLVDNAPIGIGIIADGQLRYINNELAKMGGVKNKEELVGYSAKTFLPDEDRYKIFLERYHLVIDKGENAPLYLTKLKTLTGNILDVEVVSIPLLYEGKPAMQILINDVTDRKTALDELAKSREMLHQLFENSPLGIVLLDMDFKVSNINKGFERIFGYSIAELKGNSLTDFIISPELLEESKRLNESAINGEINYFESFRYSKSGKKVPVLIYALPVRENNKSIGIYGIYVDIRQRLEAEDELKTRNMELDNFVYKVSHDLRAPLASILGLINLTKLEGDEVEKDTYIGLMEGQVQKLDHFIHDILSHSKNLKMTVSSELVNFEEIISKCFSDLDYLKSAVNITRKVEIDESEFYSDKWRISEIFRNLIGNAIKYSNPEAGENIVEVNVKISVSECEITVKDNGIGISEDTLPHVMDMFYRGTESSDGSGIGLYIVQKAVEKINGRISIESKSFVGTIIKINLPSLRNLITHK